MMEVPESDLPTAAPSPTAPPPSAEVPTHDLPPQYAQQASVPDDDLPSAYRPAPSPTAPAAPAPRLPSPTDILHATAVKAASDVGGITNPLLAGLRTPPTPHQGWLEAQDTAAMNAFTKASTDIAKGVGLDKIIPGGLTGSDASVDAANPVDPTHNTTIARAIGGVAPLVGAGVVNPLAGVAVGAAQGVGSAREEGAAQGYTAGQTATLAGERGIFNAMLGLIPGGKGVASGVGGFFEAAAKAYGLNVGQAVFENHLKDDLGLKSDSDLQALKASATSGDNAAQSLLLGGIHSVATALHGDHSPGELPQNKTENATAYSQNANTPMTPAQALSLKVASEVAKKATTPPTGQSNEDKNTIVGRLAAKYPDLKGNELHALAAEMTKEQPNGPNTPAEARTVPPVPGNAPADSAPLPAEDNANGVSGTGAAPEGNRGGGQLPRLDPNAQHAPSQLEESANAAGTSGGQPEQSDLNPSSQERGLSTPLHDAGATGAVAGGVGSVVGDKGAPSGPQPGDVGQRGAGEGGVTNSARNTVDLSNLPDYAREEIQRNYATADKAGVVDQIEQASLGRKTAKQIAVEMKDSLPGPSSDHVDMVRAVRVNLGIPSLDNASEFDAWAKSKQSSASGRPSAQPLAQGNATETPGAKDEPTSKAYQNAKAALADPNASAGKLKAAQKVVDTETAKHEAAGTDSKASGDVQATVSNPTSDNQASKKTGIFNDPEVQRAASDVRNAFKNLLKPKSTLMAGFLPQDLADSLTRLAVAVVKAGARSFASFAKEFAGSFTDGGERLIAIKYARQMYEAARTHPDMTQEHAAQMTPTDELKSIKSGDVSQLARLSPEEIEQRKSVRAASAAMPDKPPTEAQTIRDATVKPTETTKGTVLRTTGVRPTEEPTITAGEALNAKMKLMQKLLGKEPTAEEKALSDATVSRTETVKGTINRTTGVRQDEGPVVPESKALAATLAIREAFTNKEYNAVQAKAQVTEAAKDLPRSIRGDFITAIRDAKSQTDVDRALGRMDDAVKGYQDKRATDGLYDQIGKPLVEKKPTDPNLARQINQNVGMKKPEDPFVGGRIKAEEQMPVARDALTDIVKNLRSPENPTAIGAGKLADFISSERDLGHSNDGGMTEEQIGQLRGLEGKKLSELSPEQKGLLTQAIAHAAFLGKEYNEAQVGSRAYQVKQDKNQMLDGLRKYHADELPPSNRGDVETAPKKNPISQFLGNVMRDPFRFLKLNFGEGGEKQWHRLADAHTDTLEAANKANDLLKATLDKHGITEDRWRQMGETSRTIPLGDGQRMKLTPREIIGFINGWGREQTRAEMLKSGIVPNRLSDDRSNNRNISEEGGQRIIDAATPAEKDIAAAMSKYLNDSQLRTDANKASVKEFGFEKLTEPGYWPRRRAMEQIPQRIPENMQQFQEGLLKDAGFLKPAKGSSAPVAIEDAADTFNRHVKALSRFAYLNEPIRDMMMIQNDPTFHRETLKRLGDGWDKQLTDTLTRLAGMDDTASIPGAQLLNSIRGKIAAGELMFRITSAVNHYTGGLLAVNQMPEGARASFLKNFAMKFVPDMALIRDMESRNAYLRNRGMAHGQNLETPVDETAPTTAMGRFTQKAGDIGTSHIRLSDRMDSASVYKTLTDHYLSTHSDATPDAAKNWAAKQTEYVVRKTSTASTPFENNYLAQRMSRIPGVNLLTLFQSKTSAMRNVVDEAYNDWRVDKTAANATNLARAVGSVAAMMAVYAAVEAGSKRIVQGFSAQTSKEKEKDRTNMIVNFLAHGSDVLAPGIGGNLIRAIHGNTGGNIVSQTATTAASQFMRSIDAAKKGHTEQAIENAMGSINSAGKIIGLSAEQPTQYGFGLYHAATDKPGVTDADKRTPTESRTKQLHEADAGPLYDVPIEKALPIFDEMSDAEKSKYAHAMREKIRDARTLTADAKQKFMKRYGLDK